MVVEDVYGFADADLDRVRSLVERVVGVRMVPRSSDYRAGDYFAWRWGQNDEIRLQANRELDGPMELEFPTIPTLLYIVGSRAEPLRPDLLALSGVELLRPRG
jgi:hypothetical protein